ncbi:MAG: MBL fold metallo-hydrolase [Verrucomicrobiales bacterium]
MPSHLHRGLQPAIWAPLSFLVALGRLLLLNMSMDYAWRQHTGGELQTNAYAVQGPDGLILFDAPDGTTGWLHSQNLRPSVLLLTHGHFDHIGEAALVARTFGCQIGCHAEDRTMLEDPKIFRRWGFSYEGEAAQVDFGLNEGVDQTWAGVPWKLLHVPGHSPGSVCFYCEDKGLLVGGDVVFRGGVGRWDLPGGDGELLIRGIHEKILPLPDATKILPGHGPTTELGYEKRTNPFLQG